ncbi:GDSL esterase/lipase, partial [Mucuna pruriens]
MSIGIRKLKVIRIIFFTTLKLTRGVESSPFIFVRIKVPLRKLSLLHKVFQNLESIVHDDPSNCGKIWKLKMAQVMIFFSLVFLHHVVSPIYALSLAPALYVLGDSLMDNGNNNFLPNLAKANYLPYETDFPTGSTGRFTNGKTVADLSLTRINYASSSCGILPKTGALLGMYKLGDRKIIVFELGHVGWIPVVAREHPHTGDCVEKTNQMVAYFNGGLPHPMLKNMTSKLHLFLIGPIS